MSLFTEDETQMYTKAIYGCDALRFAGKVILQEQGKSQSGTVITAIVGVIAGEARSEFAVANNFPHEMIECEIIIRPIRKFAGRNHIGCGLAALVTSSAMFPEEWSHQTYPGDPRQQQP